MAWVEGGDAPQAMIAHRAGQTGEGAPVGISGGPKPDGPPPGMFPPRKPLSPRSRPVYAYPQVAVYKGAGPVDEAASFAAKLPAPVNGIAAWIGAGR